MTPRSWETWVEYYGARGYEVLTPAYPGFEIEVEALRENPAVIADCDINETIDHLADVIGAVSTPPIIMGHSFGGALTQIMLSKGLGAAGVAIDSAPTEGIRTNPPSQIKSLFPVLNNPAKRHQGRLHRRPVPLRVHEHSQQGGLAEGLRPVPHPRPGPVGLGLRPDRQLQAGPPGDLDRLLPGRAGAAAVHRGRSRPHHASVGQQVERQEVQALRRADGVPRVRGTLPLDVR
ncbi:MAG: alpha/beta hydrolase [Aeromicrobium sp.]